MSETTIAGAHETVSLVTGTRHNSRTVDHNLWGTALIAPLNLALFISSNVSLETLDRLQWPEHPLCHTNP